MFNDLARIQLVQTALILLCSFFFQAQPTIVFHLCFDGSPSLSLQLAQTLRSVRQPTPAPVSNHAYPVKLLLLLQLICSFFVHVRRLMKP